MDDAAGAGPPVSSRPAANKSIDNNKNAPAAIVFEANPLLVAVQLSITESEDDRILARKR